MGVVIASELLAAIVAQAQAFPDREICGLLLGDGDAVAEARPCRNVHPAPTTHFEIDASQLLAAHRAGRSGGRTVVGHYHSHPSGDAGPSATDAADAAPDGSLWLIVAGVDVRAWRAVRRGAIHDRFDPVVLRVVSDAAKDDG